MSATRPGGDITQLGRLLAKWRRREMPCGANANDHHFAETNSSPFCLQYQRPLAYARSRHGLRPAARHRLQPTGRRGAESSVEQIRCSFGVPAKRFAVRRFEIRCYPFEQQIADNLLIPWRDIAAPALKRAK